MLLKQVPTHALCDIFENASDQMETNNTEKSKIELEDQFILRLPPEEAKVIHKVLVKKPKKIKKYLTIDMENDMRNATVKVHKKTLHGRVFDLPTIIDSNKTIDKVHLFKTADISQMLICQHEEFSNKTFQHDHGLTPPLKNARKFRFRKTLQNKEDVEEAADVEKEVLLLLRMDNEAVSTKFEFVQDDKIKRTACTEINEMTIFGEKLSDIDSEKESGSTESEINDIMDFTN